MAKIPFVITMGVWVADVALLISGKYVLQVPKECFLTLDITGTVRVSVVNVNYFGPARFYLTTADPFYVVA